jgi:hypothetical protein
MWRRRSTLGFLFAVAACGFAPIIRADLPSGPPQDYEVISPNGRYIARMTVQPPKTSICEIGNGVEQPLWSMESYHRRVYLANDGEHLVVKHCDLIWADVIVKRPDSPAEQSHKAMAGGPPADCSPDLIIIQFMERDRIIREVTLHELMPDPSRMIRTASAWRWGDAWPEITYRGEFVVVMEDFREMRFDVTTGKLLGTSFLYRDWLRDLHRHLFLP